MTTINKLIRDEKGAIAIEATIITGFFLCMFIYVYQQVYAMNTSYTATKLSNQIVNIISQRAVLFDGASLSQSDVNSLKNFIPLLKDDKNDFFDIFIEEKGYGDNAYNKIVIPAKTRQCSLGTSLSSYGFNLQTSFGKNNSIYRVSVCRKISGFYFATDDSVITGISVMPGQHH